MGKKIVLSFVAVVLMLALGFYFYPKKERWEDTAKDLLVLPISVGKCFDMTDKGVAVMVTNSTHDGAWIKFFAPGGMSFFPTDSIGPRVEWSGEDDVTVFCPIGTFGW